jgi:SAM-dependent methyltransferase
MKSEVEIGRHNETQRTYFASRIPPTMVPRDTPYVQRQIDHLLDALALAPDARVLEIGCGMGRYTIPMARRGVAVEGLDLTPELLERFRSFEGGQSVPLHCADILDVPASLHGAFDAVIGFFMLHHLHDLEGSFRAVAGLLEKNGRVAFVEPNPWNPLYYIQIALSPGMTWKGDKGILQMRRGVISDAMRRGGLELTGVKRFGFFPPFLANRGPAQKIERAIESLGLLNPVLPFQLFTARRRDSNAF